MFESKVNTSILSFVSFALSFLATLLVNIHTYIYICIYEQAFKHIHCSIQMSTTYNCSSSNIHRFLICQFKTLRTQIRHVTNVHIVKTECSFWHLAQPQRNHHRILLAKIFHLFSVFISKHFCTCFSTDLKYENGLLPCNFVVELQMNDDRGIQYGNGFALGFNSLYLSLSVTLSFFIQYCFHSQSLWRMSLSLSHSFISFQINRSIDILIFPVQLNQIQTYFNVFAFYYEVIR